MAMTTTQYVLGGLGLAAVAYGIYHFTRPASERAGQGDAVLVRAPAGAQPQFVRMRILQAGPTDVTAYVEDSRVPAPPDPRLALPIRRDLIVDFA